MELDRFKQLLESTMGNVKPLINEESMVKGGNCKLVTPITKEDFLNAAKNSKRMSDIDKRLFKQQLPNMLSKSRFYSMEKDPNWSGTIEDQFENMLTDDSNTKSDNCFGSRLPFSPENYQYRDIDGILYVGVK